MLKNTLEGSPDTKSLGYKLRITGVTITTIAYAATALVYLISGDLQFKSIGPITGIQYSEVFLKDLLTSVNKFVFSHLPGGPIDGLPNIPTTKSKIAAFLQEDLEEDGGESSQPDGPVDRDNDASKSSDAARTTSPGTSSGHIGTPTETSFSASDSVAPASQPPQPEAEIEPLVPASKGQKRPTKTAAKKPPQREPASQADVLGNELSTLALSFNSTLVER
ncbi:hypothetical protein EIP86_005631 [Pleurotus ostreatoroseus]|nr:hypothetical protein EIP86_005631 [Pleurotus ostreatoroseus]